MTIAPPLCSCTSTLGAHIDDDRAVTVQLDVNTLRAHCDDDRAVKLQLGF